MRVLFTAAATLAATASHFHILVPLAQALHAAGQEVAFAIGPNVVPQVERLGFAAFPVGTADATLAPPHPAEPREHRWRVWEELFAGPPAASRLADLLPLCERWQPDVIVRENAELAGCIAAEALGLPHVVVQNGNFAVFQDLRQDRMRVQLDALRASQGLPPDPGFAMLARYLLLLPVPRAFHDPSLPLPPTAHFLRPLAFDRTGDEGLPEWVGTLASQPTVCMVLGTVFNARTDLFALAIAALRDEPVNLILTVGRDQDPAQFGPQPANIRIERYIPQSQLLPHCAVVMSCAGLNSVRAAFEHGIPQVLLPIAADHPFTAARCEALGLARVLDHRTATPEAVREAVRAVLADPSYRRNAERIRDEIAALPGPEHAVGLLEQLVREKQPILAS